MRNLLIFIALLAGVQCGPQRVSEVLDKGGSLDLQGHRGMRGLFPENSILGFLKALELGVNTLELDIVMSGDTQLVVSHEPFISSAICQYPGGATDTQRDGKGSEYVSYDLSRDQGI